MKAYSYADVVLRTSLDLPELPTAESCADLNDPTTIDADFGEFREPPRTVWRHIVDPAGGAPLVSVAAAAHGRLLRFPGFADFLVSDDCRRISWILQPGCTLSGLRHLLLDQVLPRVLAQRGRLVLHAGSSNVDGHAAVFVGESGSGKSTLVASLHRAGSPALSDDGVIVTEDADGVSVLALYPGVRLWPPTLRALGSLEAGTTPMADYSEKLRVRLSDAPAAGKLQAVFVLEPAPAGHSAAEIVVHPLSTRDACVELIRSSFLLDLGDPLHAAELMRRTAVIAERVPGYRLRFPLRFDLLPEVHESIRSLVGMGPLAGFGRASRSSGA